MNFLRQLDLFNGEKFSEQVHVIGAGATGSYLTLFLAKMTGSPFITVWDYDKVEDHNLPNQLYGPADVGRLKVEALEEVVERLTGVTITTEAVRCDKDSRLHGIVFLAVDSMDSRKEIFDGCIKFNPNVTLMVEMRLGIDSAIIYSINPNLRSDVGRWEKGWYPSSEAVESPCTNRMICTTVATVAGICVHRVVLWTKNKEEMPTKLQLAMPGDVFFSESWNAPEKEQEEYDMTDEFATATT